MRWSHPMSRLADQHRWVALFLLFTELRLRFLGIRSISERLICLFLIKWQLLLYLETICPLVVCRTALHVQSQVTLLLINELCLCLLLGALTICRSCLVVGPDGSVELAVLGVAMLGVDQGAVQVVWAHFNGSRWRICNLSNVGDMHRCRSRRSLHLLRMRLSALGSCSPIETVICRLNLLSPLLGGVWLHLLLHLEICFVLRRWKFIHFILSTI